jgi:hypothetical protein
MGSKKMERIMRHALGVLGVLAAGVLLAVSAAMNYRFGCSLGQSELDCNIYGAASAAADCMKALVPFYFFAAIKNRMWSQAGASAVVWVVVTSYSMMSALGHAALNRDVTAGARVTQSNSYGDLRADLKRTQEQLSWIPQHRPAMTVQGEIDAAKNKREWSWTDGCTKVNGKSQRDFCQSTLALNAELASALQADKLGTRVSDLQSKIEATPVAGRNSGADPQAAVILKLVNIVLPNTKLEDVQTALSLFVALLLEIGSGFGMYVAFSQWRLYDEKAPVAPAMASLVSVPAPVQASPMVAATRQRAVANDNKSAPKLVAPETDVERFYKECIDTQDGSSVTATNLYEDYCTWCEAQNKEPLALPTFGREFGELGVQKAKIAGRVRYIGIALKTGAEASEDTKQSSPIAQAA